MRFQSPRCVVSRAGAAFIIASTLCGVLTEQSLVARGAETASADKALAAENHAPTAEKKAPTAESKVAESVPPAIDDKATGTRSSLDQQLLDDLDNELLDGVGKKMPPSKPASDKSVGDKSADGKPAEGKPAGDKPADATGPDATAPDDESMGEDIGQGPEDPLTRIGREMRRVEQLIAEQEAALRKAEADKTGKLQQQIVKELADLIEELEKQRQQKSSSSSSKSKKKKQGQEGAAREAVKPQQPGGHKPGSKNSNQPATDSSAALRDRNAQRPDVGDMKGMMKDLWGQLPAHARDQMLQTSPEQFLPRYELQLEKYYKRLAEQQKQNP